MIDDSLIIFAGLVPTIVTTDSFNQPHMKKCQKISHLVHSHFWPSLSSFLMIDDSLIISLVPTIVTTFIQPTSYEKALLKIKSVSPTLTIL